MQGGKRSTLKIHQDKGTLTIQTQQLAIQAIFKSQILQVSDYIQQIQKYNLRAALSGLNLKIDQYDAYYTSTKDRIEEMYNTLTYKSVSMIQDLLVSLRLVKIQMWREQTAIANGIKTHLYFKTLDPYSFNPSRFDEDVSLACDILKNPNNQQQLIGELSQRLKQFQGVIMQQMFSGKVTNPFLAENKVSKQINPSSIYSSLLNEIKIKMEKFDDSYIKKHFSIQEQIIKFMQFSIEHSMKAQKIAFTIIKKQISYFIQVVYPLLRYNQFSQKQYQFVTQSIVPPNIINVKKETIDADDLFSGKQYRSQLKPAFANRVYKIQFKETNKLFDPQNNNEAQIEVIQPQIGNYRQWDRYEGAQAQLPPVSPFDSFTQRKKNNPKQFYNFREFQKQKYREEDLRIRQRQRGEREKQRGQRDRERQRQKQRERQLTKRIIRSVFVPAPWIQFTDHEFPFLYFYFQSKEKELHYWEVIKQKGNENNYISYSSKRDKHSIHPLLRTNEQKLRQQAQSKLNADMKIQQEKSALQFERKRKEEQLVRISKLKKIMEGRTYQKFAAMNKFDSNCPVFCNNETVSRYCITLSLKFRNNKQTKDIDKFFYLYFKERYYKENESVIQNVDNPIIFLDSNKFNMEGSNKIVSQYINSITKRAQSLPFFIIWGADILYYSLNANTDQKEAKFQFYPYSGVLNSQKLIYQLKRRLKFNIKEMIKEQYFGASQIENIYSKVQVVHRIIFNRHRQLPNRASSIAKGKLLIKEIFESLKQS